MLETRPVARRAPSPQAQPLAARTGMCAGWRLSRLLGRGRWTNVFQARPTSLPAQGPADYALKILRPEFQRQAEALALLHREAAVARQVCHPHLAPVLSTHLSGSPFYIVLPYLEGATLRATLSPGQSRRRLRPGVAIWLTRQIAEGLRALHDGGWLHGDVKPENIHISQRGEATLLDLGLARRLGSAECDATIMLQGSATYVAPEAFRPLGSLCGESDVYALGVTLFEALTGQPPFAAPSPATLAQAHLSQRPPDVRAIEPAVPVELAQLVRQMLAKEPLRRPAAAELIERLVALEIETLGIT